MNDDPDERADGLGIADGGAAGTDTDDELGFEHIRYEVEDHVALVTIDRPETLNALDATLLLELAAAFDIAEANADVQALVVTGTGRAFVAGADLQALLRINDGFTGRETALAGQDVMNSLAALPFPTVAAINGFALGGGLELALACDLRVASRGAKLGLPEVTRGLVPGYGGTQRLQRLIGLSRATDMVLTGRMVDAEEAHAFGLVNRLSDDVVTDAVELARVLSLNGPIAVGLAKEALVRGLDVTLAQGLEIEADLFGLAVTTQDAKEGITAFFEKRDAEFTGQ